MGRLFYASRQFLNKEGYNCDASIFTEISFYSEVSSGCDCDLKIRDCNNQVHLVTGIDDEGNAEFENSVFKLNTLIEQLTMFREALIQARREAKRREAIEEEEEKKRRDEDDKTADGGGI
jgi:hypothetical protein